jgi:hypothetical protein
VTLGINLNIGIRFGIIISAISKDIIKNNLRLLSPINAFVDPLTLNVDQCYVINIITKLANNSHRLFW